MEHGRALCELWASMVKEISAEQVLGTTPQNNTSAKEISSKQHLHLPAGATLWERRGIHTRWPSWTAVCAIPQPCGSTLACGQARRLKDNQNVRRPILYLYVNDRLAAVEHDFHTGIAGIVRF